jgi:hypothetical protein
MGGYAMTLRLCALLLLLISASSTSAQSRPRAPGIRQADQAAAQAERDIPPPTTQHPTIHLVEIEQQADELSRIAQTIPPDIDSVRKGVLPKDIVERLKQIEKLAKHLRHELTQ